MENENLAVDGDTRELVALYELFAQACDEMMATLDKFIVAFKNGSEFPPRKEWPDLLLEPDFNQISDQLAEEGRLLARFKAGELPAEAVKAGNRYIQKEDELVEKVEELAMMPSLLETRRADHALWNYMKRKTDDPVEIQQAKVKDMVAEKLRCYRQNAMSLYEFLAKSQVGGVQMEIKLAEQKAERTMLNKLERVTEGMNVLARGANKHFWHGWRGKRRVRAIQVRDVWLYVQGLKRTVEESELYVICRDVYKNQKMDRMVEYGGYPSALALYNICHAHSAEILRGV